jgi:hypothetical protein
MGQGILQGYGSLRIFAKKMRVREAKPETHRQRQRQAKERQRERERASLEHEWTACIMSRIPVLSSDTLGYWFRVYIAKADYRPPLDNQYSQNSESVRLCNINGFERKCNVLKLYMH